jgi:Reverse transcriptase (RNA-dependent DNA polymerase)
MIAGVHYDATFAPTPTNTMVRTVFALALYFLQQLGVNKKDLEHIEKEEWIIGDLFDIVQAFLNSELDPEKNPIYTYLPPYWKQYCELRGIRFDPADLIRLLKSQYGSTDSVKLWVDKFIKILTGKGGCEVVRSKVDPCVLYKKDSQGNLILLLVFHIDDAYVTGRPDEVKKMLAHLKASVEVLEIGRMDEHLGVKYSLEKDDIGWYYECKMDKYINKTVAEYEQDMKTKLQNHPTPAAPGSILMKLSGLISFGNTLDAYSMRY